MVFLMHNYWEFVRGRITNCLRICIIEVKSLLVLYFEVNSRYIVYNVFAVWATFELLTAPRLSSQLDKSLSGISLTPLSFLTRVYHG